MSSTDFTLNSTWLSITLVELSVKSVEEIVNLTESNVELRVKSVEDMVNVIESHVELRGKSVEAMTISNKG
jgi:hypothetical protein